MTPTTELTQYRFSLPHEEVPRPDPINKLKTKLLWLQMGHSNVDIYASGFLLKTNVHTHRKCFYCTPLNSYSLFPSAPSPSCPINPPSSPLFLFPPLQWSTGSSPFWVSIWTIAKFLCNLHPSTNISVQSVNSTRLSDKNSCQSHIASACVCESCWWSRIVSNLNNIFDKIRKISGRPLEGATVLSSVVLD